MSASVRWRSAALAFPKGTKHRTHQTFSLGKFPHISRLASSMSASVMSIPWLAQSPLEPRRGSLEMLIESEMLNIHKWPKSRAIQQLVELRKLATDAKLAYLQQQAEAARKLLILTYLTDDVSGKIAQYLEEFLPNQVAHINRPLAKANRGKPIS